MTDLSTLEMRELQRESARALAYWRPTNNELHVFTKQAHHDSQGFYRAVLEKYIADFGGLPSEAGPAQDIQLISDV